MNRETNAKYCLASINICKPTPRCILVDYGSAKPLTHFGDMYPWLTVVRVNNITKFHKTRALNIGIQEVKSDYTCLTDIDQIFQPNFFNILLQELRPRRFVKCKTHFAHVLPKFPPRKVNFMKYREYLRQVKADPVRDPHGEGCCQGILTKRLRALGGHDETYIGWGYEDKDLEFRARRSGLSIVWIDDRTSMVHLPHERNKAYFNRAQIVKNKAIFNRKKG